MPLLTVVRNHIQQSAIPRYERLLRFVAERARGDKDTFEWDTRISTGSEGRTLSFVTTAEGFGELMAREQPDAMVRRLFGEGDGNALLESLGEGVQSTAYTIAAVREDLSTVAFPTPAQPIPVSIVTRLRATNTGGPGLEVMIRKVIEAAQKVDEKRGYFVLQTAVGNPRNYAVVQPVVDPAQLDGQPPVPELLNQAFGEKEGQKIFLEGAANLESVESEISALRPELSNRT